MERRKTEAAVADPENPACLGNLAMSLLLFGNKENGRVYIEKSLGDKS
jgi:Flp pilus assembly protein TadD